MNGVVCPTQPVVEFAGPERGNNRQTNPGHLTCLTGAKLLTCDETCRIYAPRRMRATNHVNVKQAHATKIHVARISFNRQAKLMSNYSNRTPAAS